MSFFHKIFNFKSAFLPNSKKFLIVGLGNIGSEYIMTRHNIGFEILNYLSIKENLSFETFKLVCTSSDIQTPPFSLIIGYKFFR